MGILYGPKTNQRQLTIFEYLYFIFVQHLSVKIFEKYCKGEINGLNNIRDVRTGFILAINHNSYLDWLILYSIFKIRYNMEITFLAKEKLFKSLIAHKLIKAANCIKVSDSAGISISALRRICKIIKNKGIVGIFPEGTRSPTGQLIKAKDGAAKIAVLSKAPVVPVGLIGLHETWPKHKPFPTHFHKCIINIGKPIYLNNIINASNKHNFKYITNTIMKSIGKLIGQDYRYS